MVDGTGWKKGVIIMADAVARLSHPFTEVAR